jgi:hypothetical protein
MSNLLKMAIIDLILSLHCQGRSEHRIISELRINREIVMRYLSQPRDAANQLSWDRSPRWSQFRSTGRQRAWWLDRA